MWGPDEVQAEGTAWNLSRHTGESGRRGEKGSTESSEARSRVQARFFRLVGDCFTK